MKKHLIAFCLFINSYCSAQHIVFGYDQAGNRTSRTYSVNRLASESAPIDSSAMIESKYGIKVFPNPVSKKINVKISSLPDGEAAKIYLSDDQGKILLMKEQISKEETLDLGNFKAGVYYIRVYVKMESVSYKVVKL